MVRRPTPNKNTEIYEYVISSYGLPPKLRGISLMCDQKDPVENTINSPALDIYNDNLNEDVLLLVTNCGGKNYDLYNAKKWEERNKDTFIGSADSPRNPDLRYHFFRAINNELYKQVRDILGPKDA